jgi:hypothetical protein
MLTFDNISRIAVPFRIETVKERTRKGTPRSNEYTVLESTPGPTATLCGILHLRRRGEAFASGSGINLSFGRTGIMRPGQFAGKFLSTICEQR